MTKPAKKYKELTQAQREASYKANEAWSKAGKKSPVAGIAGGIRAARNPAPLDLARRAREREEAKADRAETLIAEKRRGRFGQPHPQSSVKYTG